MRVAVCPPVRLLALVLAVALLPGPGRAEETSSVKLNKKIDNVAFKDGGKTVALYELKDHKAVVVVFLSFECPVSNGYMPVLAQLHKEYAGKGVAFLGVCSGDDIDAASLARRIAEFKVPFPVYRDEKQAALQAFKAQVASEVCLLDGDFVLRYQGRIDDGYRDRLKPNVQITHHDLRRALDEVLGGKMVTVPVTAPVGCALARPAATAATGKVTYYRDVLPILQNNCQQCHRPGDVGPFSLMTYKQAVNWAADIKEYTRSRRMPPWKPVEGLHFHNERKLPDKDLATLAAWADGGTPEGDPKDAPPSRQFPDGWQLGKPDLILKMPEPMQVGPNGRDLFRCVVLPTGLTEDRQVVAVEVRPGNPRIVHHTLNFIDTQGRGRKLEEAEQKREKKEGEVDVGPGYTVSMGIGFQANGGVGGWAPGQLARQLPEGAFYPLPAGSDVVVQVHYHRDGRPEKDQTQIGLYFAKKKMTRRIQSVVIPGAGRLAPLLLNIPAGKDNYRVDGSVWVGTDCELHSIMPHMHMVGKKIKVTMTPPDGDRQTLVAIDDWDYNWQETYFLDKPVKVKAGTRFDVEAYYNNTASNPNNPNNPPKSVHFGEQTTDEMCFVFLGCTAEGAIKRSFEPLKKEEGKSGASKPEAGRTP
jgi:thiol-disulfide isomerase/thioredoxin